MAVEIMPSGNFSVPFRSSAAKYLCQPVRLYITQACPDNFKMQLFLSTQLYESAPENEDWD
jgi:hypothetical protein